MTVFKVNNGLYYKVKRFARTRDVQCNSNLLKPNLIRLSGVEVERALGPGLNFYSQ